MTVEIKKVISCFVYLNLVFLSGCSTSVGHDYHNRSIKVETMYVHKNPEEYGFFYGKDAIEEYSGIASASIIGSELTLKTKNYGLFEEIKAPLIRKKQIRHYGSADTLGARIFGTILFAGIPILENPSKWFDNSFGWDEESLGDSELLKDSGQKTGVKKWLEIDKEKDFTVDWKSGNAHFSSFAGNNEARIQLAKYIISMDTKKPVHFNIVCNTCVDSSSSDINEKLSKTYEFDTDLSSIKSQLINQKKRGEEEKLRKEKEAQEQDKLQKEQNDPLNPAKNQCKELGFKEKTEKFAECVVKLSSSGLVNSSQASAAGDGSQDDQTCQKYGFKPGTANYSDCRMKIDMAKQQAAQQQAQYQQQQAQYQAELKAYEDAKRKEASLKLMQFGLNMMANGGRSYSSNIGPAPVAPSFVPSTNTYFLPGGHQMTCTTTGTVTNCF